MPSLTSNRTLLALPISATLCCSSSKLPSSTSTLARAYTVAWLVFARKTLEAEIFSLKIGSPT
ncbi:hypothetical protein YQE_00886, partial [Dendroctonus ponderosae]